jgi:hypothetical protein
MSSSSSSSSSSAAAAATDAVDISGKQTAPNRRNQNGKGEFVTAGEADEPSDVSLARQRKLIRTPEQISDFNRLSACFGEWYTNGSFPVELAIIIVDYYGSRIMRPRFDACVRNVRFPLYETSFKENSVRLTTFTSSKEDTHLNVNSVVMQVETETHKKTRWWSDHPLLSQPISKLPETWTLRAHFVGEQDSIFTIGSSNRTLPVLSLSYYTSSTSRSSIYRCGYNNFSVYKDKSLPEGLLLDITFCRINIYTRITVKMNLGEIDISHTYNHPIYGDSPLSLVTDMNGTLSLIDDTGSSWD